MFNQDQKRTFLIVTGALLGGLLLGLAGCDSTGSGAEAGGGQVETGGQTVTGGGAGTGGVAGTGGGGAGGNGYAEGTCGAGNYWCPMPAAKAPAGVNPCNFEYQGSVCGYPGSPGSPARVSCGWDQQKNECWPAYYCEVSVMTNNLSFVRPASAVCPKGVTSYTYAPGTIMVWGAKYTGSEQRGYVSGVPGGETTGYLCVPNQIPVTGPC